MTLSIAFHRQVLRSTARRGTQPQRATLATFNINNALKKSGEGDSFQDLVSQPVTALQGIGPKHGQELESLGLKTIQQLADYKFFHLAKSVTVLAETEEANERTEDAVMNLHKGIDKEFQELPLAELIKQPLHALKGISPAGGELLQSMGAKTVADLATFKYCQWAEAIVVAARFEDIE
jgi:predicted flap endonuclease-1-like 5' DNA nuclease